MTTSDHSHPGVRAAADAPSPPSPGPWQRLARIIPRSMRSRIVGALLLAVGLAVVAETVLHMVEESARLEREMALHADRVADELRVELEQTVSTLDVEVKGAADPRSSMGRALWSGRVEARFLGARQRLQEGRIDVLKVLGADGTILSSGHWPSSFGALDPNMETYTRGRRRGLTIIEEPTPEGSAPAMQRWSVARSGAREVVVVAGRFLHAAALERMRSRTGADVLALCPTERGDVEGMPKPTHDAEAVLRVASSFACVAVGSPDVLGAHEFDLNDGWVTQRLKLAAVDLGTHHLWVGLDRRAVLAVRDSIIRRALVVGLASIAFAMVLGVVLAARITRPIERLAHTSGRLASGDLAARGEHGTGGGGHEVERLVDSFNRMAADLEKNQTKLLQAERVTAWQEIARGLAHELKNPLTPILGAMDVVRKARRLGRPDFDVILEEQANAVVEEVMRLKELADAFARFARLPDRKPELLRLAEVVDHAVALYASDEKITVVRRYGDDTPSVEADRTQVGTVVTNLVKNAVEAMDGGGTLTVVVRRSVEREGFVEMTIADTGPGIAAEVATRLFTPYVTTKGSRGTGLGLALAHRIVVEHGGTIEAGTNGGVGAAVTVRLPITAASVESSLTV